MTNEKIIKSLMLFNEKASKLRGFSFLQKVASGQIVHFKGGDGFPIEVIGDGPDQESIDAFVLTYRFFIQNNESCSFANLSKVYEATIIPESHRAAFNMVRKDLNNYLDGPCAVVEAHGVNTKRMVMEIFIFGGLSHANKDKKCIYDKWINDERIRPLISLEFVLILRNVWSAIDYVAGLNDEVTRSPNNRINSDVATAGASATRGYAYVMKRKQKMEPELIIVIASIISALSTLVIAWNAIASHRLSKKIDESANAHQKTTEKLTDDLKIAMLMTATTCCSANAAKSIFDEYKKEFF